MSTLKNLINSHRNTNMTIKRIKLRKHLNADALHSQLHKDFGEFPDPRSPNKRIPMADALMSGYSMFALKEQSLLAFDEKRKKNPNFLQALQGVKKIPSDTQERTILDLVSPVFFRTPFRNISRKLQRGKVMEKMAFLEGHHLLALDGTGIFSSKKISSDMCCQKNKTDGQIEYYQQMVAGIFVHPYQKVVFPMGLEMIAKQDGVEKNDCERNALKRLLPAFREDYPNLKTIVVEDGLSSNTPHIDLLEELNLRYILGAKPTDHKFLFNCIDKAVKQSKATDCTIKDPKRPGVYHCFRFVNQVPLNKSSQDKRLVNFLEYWEYHDNGKKELHFTWVTDLTITEGNVYDIMRAGRARWKIENAAFNTLKNQGYNLEHNYGLGKQHLSAVFANLMMLAFLVDQVQLMCCPLFKAARAKCSSKINLWEEIRGCFNNFLAPSMESILRRIANGTQQVPMPDLIE